MNKKGGLAAGALALLAVVGVSNLPKASESSGAAESKGSTGPVTTPVALPHLYSPCFKIAVRLRRFLDIGSDDPESWRLPKSCYFPKDYVLPNDLVDAKAFQTVRFAIATVPNPVSTHLPLFFDRLVETIQQAAQDDGYSYDSSWFPWEESRKDYTHLADQQTAEDLQDYQETQPGVMVFRGRIGDPHNLPYKNGLVVFLVSEQPTGGVYDEQFNNALHWIQLLGGFDQPTLRILGPTFSGSLPALQRDLEQYLPAIDPQGKLKIDVSSGTISSQLDYQSFHDWIDARKGEASFRTAMENDALMALRFCEYLQEQNYDPRYVAFLSEDETAFGFGPSGSTARRGRVGTCGDALNLFYPRDIATLRSAYERQSIFSAAKPQANANSPSTTLRGDLSEPASSNHDTVRSYGGQLTPLAQEAILLEIAHRLSDRQIQFIVLRSTNSLDQIFLSEFLRRAYPGGRVVIDGADLLFTRGTEGRSLHGVMLLSTYPLISSQEDWTPSFIAHSARGVNRIFGEEGPEGAYIAARELFGLAGASDPPLYDYAPPAWAVKPPMRIAPNQRPATWLSVVSHGQIWPLAVLSKEETGTPSILPGSADRHDQPLFDDGDAKPLRLPVSMWMFMLAFVACCMVHAYFCWNGSIMGSPRARAYFASVPHRQHSALIAFGSTLIAMLAVVIAASSGLFWWPASEYPFHDPWAGIVLAAVLVIGVLIAMVGWKRNYRLESLGASPLLEGYWEIHRWRRIAAWMAALFFILFVLVQIRLVSNLNMENAMPAFWRSIELASGVSPLLPQVLLIVGAYLWFWCNLRGIAHLGDDRPTLPKLDDLPKLEGVPRMPMFSQEEAARPVERAARPLTRGYLLKLLLVFLVTLGACALALPADRVRTLGEQFFGEMIFVLVCLCIAVILTDGIEMWRTWNELRQLLVYLDRLRLRRTLRALKGLAWGSIWKMSGNVLEERYRVITFQFESLRHLTNTMAIWAPNEPAELNDKIELLRGLTHCQEEAKKFAKWFVTLPKNRTIDIKPLRDFQHQLASTAGLVMKHLLYPEWQKETESLIVDRTKPSASEDKGSGVAIPIDKLPLYVTAAEEFFVLPYLAFIQNMLGRIRTIALGSLWLFVAATLAVSSYPFDPLNVLGGIFLAVFVLDLGVSVVVYAQMSRDATLSHITDTDPGQLGGDFWVRLLTFGIGPLIGLLTTLFPSISDFVFSWLQPGTQALK
jgi:hypothetical protein